MNFPIEEDRKNAINLLLYLQDTYDLETRSISQGELSGTKCSPELSVDDCFEISREAFFTDNNKYALLWLREALRKYTEKNTSRTYKWDMFEYLAHSAYLQGNISEAIKFSEGLLNIFPEHQRAAKNLHFFEELMENLTLEMEDRNDRINSGAHPAIKLLCNKTKGLSVEILSILKCRYVHKGDPFLLIGPLKEEEMYLDPRIIVYRQILHDDEIEILKMLAKPKQMPSLIIKNDETFEPNLSLVRVSKTTWLEDTEHPVIETIKRRVQSMTTLSAEGFEWFQIAYYEIGGHYRQHYDFFQLNEVEEGGATVFPVINVALWPEKGSAAFWYNLHPSGDGDLETLHSACPVLFGSKWVATYWIREKAQNILNILRPH